MKKKESEDTIVYVIGWIIIGAVILLGAGAMLFPELLLGRFRFCIFLAITGFYCPGCGGTRAAVALLHGRVLKSFLLQPFVLYVTIVGGWFMISQTIARISKGKIAIGMKYRDVYLWIGLALVLGNCLIKNVLKVCGWDIMQLL